MGRASSDVASSWLDIGQFWVNLAKNLTDADLDVDEWTLQVGSKQKSGLILDNRLQSSLAKRWPRVQSAPTFARRLALKRGGPHGKRDLDHQALSRVDQGVPGRARRGAPPSFCRMAAVRGHGSGAH